MVRYIINTLFVLARALSVTAQALDLDGEGSVSIDEFIQGTIRAQGQPTSLDVFIVKGNLLKVPPRCGDR